jgi:Fur family peroxide stress response transcriptional regulator
MVIKSDSFVAPERSARLEALLASLRASGYRLTSQRRAILEALVFSESHPGAEDIYQEVVRAYPSMSRATVYKTLEVLRRTGQVLELESREGGPGNRYDGFKPHSHPHLVCTECGTIIDVDEDPVKDLAPLWAATQGFRLHDYRVYVYGRCSKCG